MMKWFNFGTQNSSDVVLDIPVIDLSRPILFGLGFGFASAGPDYTSAKEVNEQYEETVWLWWKCAVWLFVMIATDIISPSHLDQQNDMQPSQRRTRSSQSSDAFESLPLRKGGKMMVYICNVCTVFVQCLTELHCVSKKKLHPFIFAITLSILDWFA